MDMVELLLAQPGIDVNREDEEGYTPLDYAEENGHTECAYLLRAAGAELQLTVYNEGLKDAANGGYIDNVQLLLEKGADADEGLECAAKGGHMDIVQLLLSKGATDYDGGLYYAARGGYTEIIQLMLENSAAPDWGLGGAAEGGRMDVVQLMLDKGATNLDSALKAAVDNGHTECAELIRAAMKK
jgi:ankyrin repeat protein